MSNNLLTLTIINKDLGENFDNLIIKCREYKEVLLKEKLDITDKVNILIQYNIIVVSLSFIV